MCFWPPMSAHVQLAAAHLHRLDVEALRRRDVRDVLRRQPRARAAPAARVARPSISIRSSSSSRLRLRAAAQTPRRARTAPSARRMTKRSGSRRRRERRRRRRRSSRCPTFRTRALWVVAGGGCAATAAPRRTSRPVHGSRVRQRLPFGPRPHAHDGVDRPRSLTDCSTRSRGGSRRPPRQMSIDASDAASRRRRSSPSSRRLAAPSAAQPPRGRR